MKIDKNVKNNDIITFYKDNSFITHRIIDYKDDEQIITKGDANNTTDKYITKDMIIGKVVYTIHEFGIVKRVLVNSKVMISLFVTIILFSLAFSITNKKEGKNEE